MRALQGNSTAYVIQLKLYKHKRGNINKMAKVLLAEDDLEIRSAYAFYLQKQGHKIYLASNAEEAWELLNKHRPQVILLDMLMPGESGLEFMRNNNLKKTFPAVKVLAFSNIENPNIIKEAKELGAVDYLIKANVTPAQVGLIINNLAK
jgi:CheY-like chemotaxis protein